MNASRPHLFGVLAGLLLAAGLVISANLATTAWLRIRNSQFIYTRSGEAKVEMLAEATRDARARAEQISAQGNRAIVSLHSAEMGIFQITPLYSSQTSWQGENDMSSVDKTITAVVTATFTLK